MNHHIAVEVTLLTLGDRRHDCGMCIVRRWIWSLSGWYSLMGVEAPNLCGSRQAIRDSKESVDVRMVQLGC